MYLGHFKRHHSKGLETCKKIDIVELKETLRQQNNADHKPAMAEAASDIQQVRSRTRKSDGPQMAGG